MALEECSKLWQLNFNCTKTFVLHLGKCYLHYTGGVQLQVIEEHNLGIFHEQGFEI